MGRESIAYNEQFVSEEHRYPYHPKINNNSAGLLKVDSRLPIHERTPQIIAKKKAWLEEQRKQKEQEEAEAERVLQEDLEDKNVHKAYVGLRVDPKAFEHDYKNQIDNWVHLR
jgi:hypothetical protein